MKKLFLFLVVAGTLSMTSCSKDDDDSSNAIVGTWVMESSFTINDYTSTSRDVWVFNSDETGTYTESEDSQQIFESTFTWAKDGDSYNVVYDDVEMSADSFSIGNLLGTDTLEDEEGYTVAIRE